MIHLYSFLGIFLIFLKIKLTLTVFPKAKFGKIIFSQKIVDNDLSHLIIVFLKPGHGKIKLFFN